MIFIPTSFSGREALLYLVVGLGGSWWLRSMGVDFPYHLIPIAFCLIYSVVAEIRRAKKGRGTSPRG
jgi:hypothetical protein